MKVVRTLRLVHPMRPMLTKAQLAHFATPLTWPEILDLDPEMTRTEWRDGVIDADSYGWQLLTYLRGPKPTDEETPELGQWVLTDKGRAYVGRVAA